MDRKFLLIEKVFFKNWKNKNNLKIYKIIQNIYFKENFYPDSETVVTFFILIFRIKIMIKNQIEKTGSFKF